MTRKRPELSCRWPLHWAITLMPHTFTHAAAATATTAARRRRGGVKTRRPFKATRHQTNWHLASLNLEHVESDKDARTGRNNGTRKRNLHLHLKVPVLVLLLLLVTSTGDNNFLLLLRTAVHDPIALPSCCCLLSSLFSSSHKSARSFHPVGGTRILREKRLVWICRAQNK